MSEALLRFAALIALLVATPARAQWQPNGTPVCTSLGDQQMLVVVPDGAGGAIVVWQDRRSPANPFVYAQRLDANGVPQWTPNGVRVSPVIDVFRQPAAVYDGAGGVIVTWGHVAMGAYEVWAQRVGSDGTLLWGIGVPIFHGHYIYGAPVIVSDNRSDSVEPPGAMVAWRCDLTDEPAMPPEVRAQAVDAGGNLQWQENGVVVCAAEGEAGLDGLTIVTDGTAFPSQGPKGAIISWTDSRTGLGLERVFSQRLSPSGVPLWAINGIEVGPDIDYLEAPVSFYLGAGNAIVAWDQDPNGHNNILMQRVGASGGWQPAPIPVCTLTTVEEGIALTSDTFGGAVLAWEDSRASASAHDVYAQSVSASGNMMWTPNGVALCTAAGRQSKVQLVPDINGGAVAIWVDERSGIQSDLYARRVDGFGVPRWADDGVPLCTATGTQTEPSATGDYAGGAIVAWADNRAGNWDIYAQRVTIDGGVVGVEHERPDRFRLSAPSPNPSTGPVTLQFELAEATPVSAWILDVRGRAVCALASGQDLPAGRHVLRWDGTRDSGEPAAPGVYFVRVNARGAVASGKVLLIR